MAVGPVLLPFGIELGWPALFGYAAAAAACVVVLLLCVSAALRERVARFRRRAPLPVEAVIFSDVTTWDGLATLLGSLRAQGFHCAIVTVARRAAFDKETAGCPEIVGLLDALVSGDEVQKTKPAPDALLEAARRLRCDPTRCLVFEADPFGVEAAHRAGMLTAALSDKRMPGVAARIKALSPEWLLRSIAAFDTREIARPPDLAPSPGGGGGGSGGSSSWGGGGGGGGGDDDGGGDLRAVSPMPHGAARPTSAGWLMGSVAKCLPKQAPARAPPEPQSSGYLQSVTKCLTGRYGPAVQRGSEYGYGQLRRSEV